MSRHEASADPEQEKKPIHWVLDRDKIMPKKFLIAVTTAATLMTSTLSPACAFGLGSFSRQGPAREELNLPGRPAPLAFQLFCLKYRSECKTTRGHSLVTYTSRVKATLASVNRSVNSSIRPKHDLGDTWSLNPREGDCEDYVLTKRSRLIRAGIPASALRIAVVKTSAGEGHAVLFVKTSAGEFVLDNLRSSIVKRQAMPYRFVSASSGNPLRWNNS